MTAPDNVIGVEMNMMVRGILMRKAPINVTTEEMPASKENYYNYGSLYQPNNIGFPQQNF